MSRHELIGTYIGLKHPSCCWDNTDGTQTIIAKIASPDGLEHIVKGTVYPGQLVRDLCYRFFGAIKEYRGADQFVFDSFVTEQPAGSDAIVAYLTQCHGIGPAMARSIYAQYGDNAIQKLREHPESVADSTPRLTVENAVKASEFLKKSEKTERTKVDLLSLIKGRGFPKRTIDALIDDWGASAAAMVRRNPYLLMHYKGCGFLKTDRMYLDLGLNPGRAKRQALCAWHAVAQQSGGDTWFPFAIVRDHLRKSISSASIDIERAMSLAVRSGMLSERCEKGQRWVAESSKAKQESRIAELVDEARREFESETSRLLWDGIASELSEVTDHQRENAHLATSGFIAVLAGRPGTGKTYTVARLVQILNDRYGFDHIAIAAPTGKAAVRVTAAMTAAGLMFRASTLHSLLGFTGEGFSFNRQKPLPYKFIVVDESSMIDASMMVALLEARAEGTHILFVGDPNQLAPVGHGAPLRDFIMANVPHGELKLIRRNSGRIVQSCADIIDHSRLSVSPSLDLPTDENLAFLEKATPEEQVDTLAALFQRFQRDFNAGIPSAIDPVWDAQVIVAVNDKSELGRKPLNVKLQQLLNPDGRRVDGNPFRVGDKIINTKNASYKSIATQREESEAWHTKDGSRLPNEETTAYVANGEQAEVIDVDTTKIIARLTSPDRTILIPRSAKKVTESGDSPDDNDDEATGSGCAWELGYAISGHKSQGSEWKYAVVVVDDYPGAKMVQSKQWIYTSISRAKVICFLIGQLKTANQACSRDALFARKTFLVEEIRSNRKRIAITAEVLELLLAGV